MTAEVGLFRQRPQIGRDQYERAGGCIRIANRATRRAAVTADVELELGSTSAAFEKEGADRVIVGETNRAVEGLGGLMRTVQSPHQLSANGPVGLVGNHRMRIDLIQQRQSRLSPVHFGIGSRTPRQRRWMVPGAPADHRMWLWPPNPSARCGPGQRAPI